MNLILRKAKSGDVKIIHRMINQSSVNGEMLPRSLMDIYNCLRDFIVAVDDDTGNIFGICALHIFWENLAEIRSLYVDDDHRKLGVGKKLAEACISEAITLELYKVFTLTYKKEFFEKLGFREIDRKELPEKIWSDCFKCPRYPDYCDEVAMIMEF
jgi:amino-acid N-acetyltransferase